MRASPSNFELPEPESSLRTAEVARVLGVSARAVRTWADEGKIACYRTFGGHRLFSVSEVRRVLTSWGGNGRQGISNTVAAEFVVLADDGPASPQGAAEQGATNAG